jgi:SAM-dependent methyltransferase
MRKIDNHPESSPESGVLESPQPNERVYDQSISISGTFGGLHRIASPCTIRAWVENVCIGETLILRQLDVQGLRFGYKLLAKIPEPIMEPRAAAIVVTLSVGDPGEAKAIGKVPVQLVPARLVERHYGTVVSPNQVNMLHRENIYGSGPPAEQPFPEALRLVLEYLPQQSSVIDVGCGAGAFGPELIKAGHNWFGLERDEHCIALLQLRQLPHRQLQRTSAHFPCADREFDHAICIEVLEHAEEPGNFIEEIARVIRGRALFSVPNLEVLPLFKDWDVVPWHLLEASHRNFFTRASLHDLLKKYFSQVEVFSYGEHPLRTRDEIALHLHLFAIADL